MLRTYTPEFGQKMASLLPSFNRSPAMKSHSFSWDEQAVAQQLSEMPMGDLWSDAGVPELLG